MKNDRIHQLENSKGKDGNRLPIIGLLLGIIFIASTIMWLTFSSETSSRFSTPLEIATQEEFQVKLILYQKEFHQKIDAIAKESKLITIGK